MAQVRPVLDIPLFHKAYSLYKLLYSYHARIPKTQRYTLWQKIEEKALNLLETLIETSHRQGEDRLQTLHTLSHRLDLLKVLIRLAKETRTIDTAQFISIQTILQEIGKMIGGWIKSVPH